MPQGNSLRLTTAHRESILPHSSVPAVTSDSCRLAIVPLNFVSFRFKNPNSRLRCNASKTESEVIIWATQGRFLSSSQWHIMPWKI